MAVEWKADITAAHTANKYIYIWVMNKTHALYYTTLYYTIHLYFLYIQYLYKYMYRWVSKD